MTGADHKHPPPSLRRHKGGFPEGLHSPAGVDNHRRIHRPHCQQAHVQEARERGAEGTNAVTKVCSGSLEWQVVESQTGKEVGSTKTAHAGEAHSDAS